MNNNTGSTNTKDQEVAESPALCFSEAPQRLCDDETVAAAQYGTEDDIFYEEEILKNYETLRKEEKAAGRDTFVVKYTENDKAIVDINTVGIDASAAMLIIDRGKDLNVSGLRTSKKKKKKKTEASPAKTIESAGLTPLAIRMFGGGLGGVQEINKMIKNHGPALITIQGAASQEYHIVVDDISNKNEEVRLRDPNKGREITVALSALTKRFVGGLIIQSKYERTYPGMHCNEDMIYPYAEAAVDMDIFYDEEILRVHSPVREECTKEEGCVAYSANGTALIQQQSIRGSFAAAAAMLIIDNGKTPDYATLKKTCAEDEEFSPLQDASLMPMETRIATSKEGIKDLKELIEKNGSALVTIHDSIVGDHTIVVDEISSDLKNVCLRDPNHGWEITVKSRALRKRLKGGDIVIQVKKNA
ncbi:MAG: hypothetical protein HN411_01000 [Waddliaceae bacterium]|jgi:hypothetical protein|nr:hypothetical protein [Waddliaceae bacterium]MBT3579669.1 hypothetical protein [Waddliaceae bacterium]MBT4445254.1 hypothetical protein [Waddliaceae bacterium]MBT6928086.1 hypothetical protein [Waddliaceae bacterium]MBT7264647.1 hypothetical protein [Waddliaceae bacterium]